MKVSMKKKAESDNLVLISSLDNEKLLEISLKIAKDDYQGMLVNLTNGSPILNPNSRNSLFIVDFSGLQAAHDNCVHSFHAYMRQIRDCWSQREHLAKASGRNPKSTIEQACNVPSDDIAELAVVASVKLKEVQKLLKKIHEIEESQKLSVQRRCLYRGSIQRGRIDSQGIAQISRVDGMAVDERGIVTELNITAEEYLEECKERRMKKKRAA